MQGHIPGDVQAGKFSGKDRFKQDNPGPVDRIQPWPLIYLRGHSVVLWDLARTLAGPSPHGLLSTLCGRKQWASWCRALSLGTLVLRRPGLLSPLSTLPAS